MQFNHSHWRLIKSGQHRGAQNMAIDEAILEMVERDTSPPTLRLYAWEPTCLSIGYAQKISDVDINQLEKLGWDVVRRLTGGRAILHANELTYAVIGAPSDARLSGSIPKSYQKLARGLLKGLQLMGLSVETQSANETSNDTPNNPICFQSPATQEIIADGKKIIGSAQARRKNGVLQHGTLPLSGNLARITQVLNYDSEELRRAAGERLLDNATTVESVVGHQMNWDSAARAMAAGFADALNLSFEVAELSKDEIERANELEQTKYASESWLNKI